MSSSKREADMAKTLIKNASIVSMDPEVGEIEGGGVLIEDGLIAEVGENLSAPDAETIDASGMILLPGLINAHMHTWQTALRGLGGDWGGRSYFEIAHETLAPRYRPEDIYIATLVGAWAQMDAGTTTLFDWCHNNPTPEHTERRDRRPGGIRHPRPFRARNAQAEAQGGRTSLFANPASRRRDQAAADGPPGFR